ncbi:hypothetical protein GCM10027347_61360 [Larkinella harenae]
MLQVETKQGIINFPSAWEEVNLGQFVAISAIKDATAPIALGALADNRQLFSSLSDEHCSQILAKLDFLQTPLRLDALTLPEYVTIENRRIKVLEWPDLRMGHTEYLRDLGLGHHDLEDIEGYSFAVPFLSVLLYYQVSCDPSFGDFDKFLDIAPSIQTMSCLEAVPLANHYMNLWASGEYRELRKGLDPELVMMKTKEYHHKSLKARLWFWWQNFTGKHYKVILMGRE